MLNTDELVAAIVEACDDRPDLGRTALQKLVYLSSAALGWPSSGHTAYLYGPFSRSLERSVRGLVRAGLVAEEVEGLGFTGSEGHPGRRFHYALTREGRAWVHDIEEERPQDVAAVRDFVDKTVQALSGRIDQRVLSLAAKVHYIAARSDGPTAASAIADEGRDLGWRISNAQVDRVIGLLVALNLVEVTRQEHSGVS